MNAVHFHQLAIPESAGACPSSIISRWGHSIQTLGASASETVRKTYNIAAEFFMKTVFYTRIGLHMAWGTVKGWLISAGSSLQLAGTKVAQASSAFFANLWASAKDGMIGVTEGVKTARSFVVTHKKETLIGGAAIIATAVAIHAISRAIAHYRQQTAPAIVKA